jgi:serine/threonine-protein phosphatase 2A activator
VFDSHEQTAEMRQGTGGCGEMEEVDGEVSSGLNRTDKVQSYHHYMRYITLLCNSVRGGKTRTSVATPAAGTPLDGLLRLLDACRSATDIHPPAAQAQRFGNAAFRQWHQWLQEVSAPHLCIVTVAQNVDTLLEPVVCAQPRAHIELREYLFDAFGNATRIDYGTGVLNFC